MSHHCMEGERVHVNGSKIVDVDRRQDPSPGGTPTPLGERGREPPYFFFLGLPLDGRRISTLVLGRHGSRRAGAPPRLDLSLCFFSVSHLYFWPKTIS